MPVNKGITGAGADCPGTPVDITRLTEGLQTMFFGMSEIFGSIGAAEAGNLIASGVSPEAASAKKSNSSSVVKTAQNAPIKTEDKPKTAKSAATTEPKSAYKPKPEPQETVETSSKSNEPIEPQPNAEPEQKPEDSKPGITMKEIIGIVTQKIEADRSNSAKIGDIVKSFGISKLTELPEDKYEAFMTQLTTL